MSNQYGNTGIDFTRIGASRSTPPTQIPFVADPHNQPTTVTGARRGTFQRDRHDRSRLQVPVGPARQHGLRPRARGLGLIGTTEFLCSKNVKDIAYQNLNFVPVRVRGVGRPAVLHAQRSPTLSDVILLTNTDQGYAWSMAFEVRAAVPQRLFISGSYSYGGRSRSWTARRTRRRRTGATSTSDRRPNNAPLARSNFDPGHRITLTASYDIPFAGRYSTSSRRSSTAASRAVRARATYEQRRATATSGPRTTCVYIPHQRPTS